MRQLEEKEIKELIETALAQRNFSYAPYSQFRVGAALLAKNNRNHLNSS